MASSKQNREHHQSMKVALDRRRAASVAMRHHSANANIMDLNVKKLSKIISQHHSCKTCKKRFNELQKRYNKQSTNNGRRGCCLSHRDLDNFIITLSDSLNCCFCYDDDYDDSSSSSSPLQSSPVTTITTTLPSSLSSSSLPSSSSSPTTTKNDNIDDITFIHESIGIACYNKKDYTSAFASFTKAIWIQSSKNQPDRKSISLNLERITATTNQQLMRRSFKRVLF